ncbi:hypothetical protein AYI68_g7274, partial [Smittium mucronatum]
MSRFFLAVHQFSLPLGPA